MKIPCSTCNSSDFLTLFLKYHNIVSIKTILKQCTWLLMDVSLISTAFGQNRPRDAPKLQLSTTLQAFIQPSESATQSPEQANSIF